MEQENGKPNLNLYIFFLKIKIYPIKEKYKLNKKITIKRGAQPAIPAFIPNIEYPAIAE